MAAKVRAGCVVVNDMIVPTADPCLPFGGRGQSGFGVTRGLEGLLAMTSIKAIAARRGRWLPHLRRPHCNDARLIAAYVRMVHTAGWRERIASAIDLSRTLLARRKSSRRELLGDTKR